MDEKMKALAQKAADDLKCPRCNHVGWDLEWRLKAKPIGSFSLAGGQMKFSASEVPVVTCRGCGISAEGRL